MSFEPVEKIIAEINSSTLSNEDKRFLVDHSLKIAEATITSCSQILIKEMDDRKASDLLVEQYKKYIDGSKFNKGTDRQLVRDAIIVTNIPDVETDSTDLRIYFSSSNVELIEMFKAACYANFPKEFRMFHLANRVDYQRFDFWKPVVADVVKIAWYIQEEIGIAMFKHINDEPKAEVSITDDWVYTPFDAVEHVWDDFYAQ